MKVVAGCGGHWALCLRVQISSLRYQASFVHFRQEGTVTQVFRVFRSPVSGSHLEDHRKDFQRPVRHHVVVRARVAEAPDAEMFGMGPDFVGHPRFRPKGV